MTGRTLLTAFLGITALWPSALAAAATCESIAALNLPNAKVTTALQIAPGTFTPPGAPGPNGPAPVFAKLPEFCRVAATLAPSSDSDIKIEVWLPASGWNGKFQAVGNGGWAGNVPYPAMANAVLAGYATAGTDTGHVGGTAAFALGHPEKVIDFGYRAVHEMTVKAKSMIDAFYGSAPTLSIWNGCSQGGRQGITEAVRFPADFDGIIAGAPAVNGVHLHAGRVAINRAVNATAAGAIPASKYPFIHQAVLAACDAKDGVADGVLENPGACAFDPKVLQCSGQDDSTCLSVAQVESATRMYEGARHPTTKAVVLPGLAPGAELGWNVIGNTQPIVLAVDAFKYVIMKDKAWDATRFNAGIDLDVALAADPDDALGSTNADLRPFFARGGKLLMYHGWSDPQVTPYNTIDFFHKVLATQGGAGVGTSVQLYMVPGMNHCQGGPGTDSFNKMSAIEEWIRTGSAPSRIEAAHLTNGAIDRTRPLCPWGQVAKWNGSGSTDDTANFACVGSSVSSVR
jgi:Tannase and feruloyl esterase